MAIFITSDKNLRTLKNILMQDFEIRSAHASEGIAALCGFRTNAAMKTDMVNYLKPPVVELDFERFERRLQQIGYGDRFALDYLRVKYTNITLEDNPWGSFKRNEKNLRDEWFYECQRKNIPFITINKKNKYCTLEWDCISIEPGDDSHVMNDMGSELVKTMFKAFQLICNHNEPKAVFDGKAFVGDIVNLSENSARMLASSFFLWLSPWTIDSRQLA